MKAIIVSGAPQAWIDFNAFKQQSKLFVIGVDRGAITLLNNGIIPTVSIGDFDSISETELQSLTNCGTDLIMLDSRKDETDTEIAILHATTLSVTEIQVYGALGGRLDHTLANIRLLLKFVKQGIRIQLEDETNLVRILSPGSYEFEPLKASYLSFFALEEEVENLTLTGVKYPLKNYLLRQDDIRCISNELASTTLNVSFSHGFLLMIESQD